MKKYRPLALRFPLLVFIVLVFGTIQSFADDGVLLEETFGSYIDDAALEAAWPKITGDAISELRQDPEDSGTKTLFSMGGRRSREFGPVTPTDDKPLYVRVEYYDDFQGLGGREYIGLWTTPSSFLRAIDVGLHNHDPANATDRYTARVVGSEHGWDWFDLHTERATGWRLIELWIYEDTVQIYFDGELDAVVTGRAGPLGAVRLGGLGSGESWTGVHYKNLLVEQRDPPPPPFYSTGFEYSEGYSIGSLHGQDGWVIDAGTASVVAGAEGQWVVLEPAPDPDSSRTRISRDFTEFLGEPVVFVDFLVRGGAGEAPSNTPEASSPSTFYVAVAAEGDVGRFYVLDGAGVDGAWVQTNATVPIDENDELLEWAVITIRLDYIRQTFDLYVNGAIAGFDYRFIGAAQSFSRFVLSGSREMEVLFDDFYASPAPLIWDNQSRDGIADSWKSLHDLPLSGDIRDDDPYEESFTNIERFFWQTGFETESEGALVFFDNFESGEWEETWTEWPSKSSLVLSSAQNRTGGGKQSMQLSNSDQKMARNLGGSGVEGAASFIFWIFDDMGSQTRWFGEARNGFQQVFSIGRYYVGFGSGTGELEGETPDFWKYQGRVHNGVNSGWFNLDAPGSPDRSPGWHKFEIRRLSDGTTIEFYVDGILSRTITDAIYLPITSVTIGAGEGTLTGDAAWFDDVRVEYLDPPSIEAQPKSRIVHEGSAAGFVVTATGNVESYQWQFNGEDIPGANSRGIGWPNVSPSQAGEYRVAVTNAVGTVVSEPAYLAVVSKEPQHQTVDAGETAVFSVNAGGLPQLDYQWRKAGLVFDGENVSWVDLSDGKNISGANSPVLTIADVTRNDEAPYSVLLSIGEAHLQAQPALLGVNGHVVFNDYFSSGNLDEWSPIPSATDLSISLREGPMGGSHTAQMTTTRDKMHHNLSMDVGGPARAVFWIYDDGSRDVRWFGEVRAYQTDGFSMNDKLDQVLAIGKYHVAFGGGTGMLAGETVNTKKYQARVAFGEHTGWFNLDGPGSPDVAVGWRKFEIERLQDGGTLNFYVDGILSRTIIDAAYAEWDVVTIGSSGEFSSGFENNAWFGGVTVEYFDPIPPFIRILYPNDGDRFQAPAEIIIEGEAYDSQGRDLGGSVFANGEVIQGEGGGQSTHWLLVWDNVPPGDYVLTAVATDADGLTGNSNEVQISVVEPCPGGSWNLLQRLRSDDFIDLVVERDESGRVSRWIDHSTGQNDMEQSDAGLRPSFIDWSAHPSGAGTLAFEADQTLIGGEVFDDSMEDIVIILAWRAFSMQTTALWEYSHDLGSFSIQLNEDGTYGFAVNGTIVTEPHYYEQFEHIVSAVWIDREGPMTNIRLYHNAREAEPIAQIDTFSIGGNGQTRLGGGPVFDGEIQDLIIYNNCIDQENVTYYTSVFENAYKLSLDWSGNGLPDDLEGDANWDGIPNWWLLSQGLNPWDPFVAWFGADQAGLIWLERYILDHEQTGHWPLSYGEGVVAKDHSIFENDGDLSDFGVAWSPDRFGIELDGLGQVTVGNPDDGSLDLGSNSVTMSVWFRTTGMGVQTLFSKGSYDHGPGYAIGLAGEGEGGQVFATLGGDAAALHIRTNEHFNDGQWHHAVAVFDRVQELGWIYVDGERQEISSDGDGTVSDGDILDFSGVTGLTASSDKDFFIGAMADLNNEPVYRITGEIADVRLYDMAVSAPWSMHSTSSTRKGLAFRIGGSLLSSAISFSGLTTTTSGTA